MVGHGGPYSALLGVWYPGSVDLHPGKEGAPYLVAYQEVKPNF